MLTLSGAILGFSINLFIQKPGVAGFLVITWASAAAGVGLSVYVGYVLYELGKHIRTYFTVANRLAARDNFLRDYIDPEDVEAAVTPEYRAHYPKFIKRLMIAPLLFALGHIAWASYVAQQNVHSPAAKAASGDKQVSGLRSNVRCTNNGSGKVGLN